MNKIWVMITIVVIVGLITGVTIYKVLDKHNAKLLLVEEKYIIEQTKKCLNEGKCEGDKITLEKLYDLGYLEKEANPVTKEYYDSASYVEIKDTNYTFVSVN